MIISRFSAIVASLLLLAACDTDMYQDTSGCRDDDSTTNCPLDEPDKSQPDAAKSPVVPTIFDVKSLVGSTKDEVSAKWGTAECPPRNACIYGDNREIYYVDGRAANLTLPPVEDLRSYGLDLGAPEFENAEVGVRRWKTTINGRPAEISQFENYVYIKTAETWAASAK